MIVPGDYVVRYQPEGPTRNRGLALTGKIDRTSLRSCELSVSVQEADGPTSRQIRFLSARFSTKRQGEPASASRRSAPRSRPSSTAAAGSWSRSTSRSRAARTITIARRCFRRWPPARSTARSWSSPSSTGSPATRTSCSACRRPASSSSRSTCRRRTGSRSASWRLSMIKKLRTGILASPVSTPAGLNRLPKEA